MLIEEFLKLDIGKRFKVKINQAIDEVNRRGITDHSRRQQRLMKILDLYHVQQTILQRSLGPGRILKEPCEKCGGDVYCGFHEEGTFDSYYYFWHLCLNCLDADYAFSHIGQNQENEGDRNCPFCGEYNP